MKVTLYNTCILVSSLSFIAYTLAFLFTAGLRSEFKALKVEKFSNLVVLLEFLGAIGLLVGYFYKPILLLSSLGLSTLMFLGVLLRIIHKNHFKFTLQALFFMILNAYIFFKTI